MTKLKTNLDAVKQAANYFKDEMAKYRQLTKEEECLILPSQAATMLGISPQAVECRMKDGSLQTFTVLGRHWVSGKEVEGIFTERIQKKIADGNDKNEIEDKFLKKMIVNAQVMKKRAQKTKIEKK